MRFLELSPLKDFDRYFCSDFRLCSEYSELIKKLDFFQNNCCCCYCRYCRNRVYQSNLSILLRAVNIFMCCQSLLLGCQSLLFGCQSLFPPGPVFVGARNFGFYRRIVNERKLLTESFYLLFTYFLSVRCGKRRLG